MTANLWNALHRLRHHSRPRRLWIDQICINQGRTYERNRQVQLMGKVYRQARQVIVWLGDVKDNETTLFDTYVKPTSNIYNLAMGSQLDIHQASDIGIGKAEAWFMPYAAGRDDIRDYLRKALLGAQPSWWRRLWVRLIHFLDRKIMLTCSGCAGSGTSITRPILCFRLYIDLLAELDKSYIFPLCLFVSRRVNEPHVLLF